MLRIDKLIRWLTCNEQANTLVNDKHEAVLCDFGLTKGPISSGFTTSVEGFKGSIPWCSHELYTEEAPRSKGSDIWALGCLIVEVTTFKQFDQVIVLTTINRSCKALNLIMGSRERHMCTWLRGSHPTRKKRYSLQSISGVSLNTAGITSPVIGLPSLNASTTGSLQ